MIKFVPSLSPVAIAGARLSVGFVCVLPLVAFFPASRTGFVSTLCNPQAYKLAVLMVGYYLLATAAFQTAPVAEVALLISTSPLFVLILRRINGSVPARNEIIGAVVAFVGLTIIFIPAMHLTGDLHSSHFLGQLFSTGAAVAAALYAFLYRLLAGRPSSPDTLGVSLMTFVIGTVILGLLFALGGNAWDRSAFDIRTVVLLLIHGVMCTAVPTVGFAFVAGVFAYVFLGERLSPTFIPGAILVVLGIVTILRKGNKVEDTKE